MSVCYIVSCISPLEHPFVLKMLSHTQRATKVKIFVGFSLKPLCCGDPALPALYGYPSSAIFCYAEKHACAITTCACVVNGLMRIQYHYSLTVGVAPRGYVHAPRDCTLVLFIVHVQCSLTFTYMYTCIHVYTCV